MLGKLVGKVAAFALNWGEGTVDLTRTKVPIVLGAVRDSVKAVTNAVKAEYHVAAEQYKAARDAKNNPKD